MPKLLAPEILWVCPATFPGAMMGSTRPVWMMPQDMRQKASAEVMSSRKAKRALLELIMVIGRMVVFGQGMVIDPCNVLG